MTKAKSINIPLTDELKDFVTSQAGDGTMYSTPSEYIRDLIRHDRQKQEIEELRNSILEGYQDIAAERVTPFTGNLKKDIGLK